MNRLVSEVDYWDDPRSPGRHGTVRWVYGDDRPWRYSDYDEEGHETVRVEQRDGSQFPEGLRTLGPLAVSEALDFPFEVLQASDAFVTVSDYTPPDGDTAADNDAGRPRRVVRYAVRGGVPTRIAETRFRYVRGMAQGFETICEERWRIGPAEGEAAYSRTTTFSVTGVGTPKSMRGEVVESLDEDGVLVRNTFGLDGGVVVRTSRRSYRSRPFPTYEVTETDDAYGKVLRRATCLSDGDAVIAEERSVYDEKGRLRATTWLDGASTTNAYSCCRLLWRRDREGRRTLRSAETGTDHLYYADEDVWLGDVSTNGAFRVTQHFLDALGRETNTVVYAGSAPGEAMNALASTGRVLLSETTDYPYGGSAYSVRVDGRGKSTQTSVARWYDREERTETVLTNDFDFLETIVTAYRGGGTSTLRSWRGAGEYWPESRWTRESRFDDWLDDGRRVACVVTRSSDCGAVTNSVSTYDLLGRLVSTEVPGANGSTLVTSNVYDGASSRVLLSIATAGDIVRTTAHVHNDLGEQVGTELDGVTNRTDVAYVLFSNEIWRVESTAVTGPCTNSVSVVKTRLTGLSDSCRRHAVAFTGSTDATGVRTETVASFDAESGVETETTTSPVTASVARRSLYGLVLTNETAGTTTVNAYDALGRVVATMRGVGGAGLQPRQSFAHSPAGDLLVRRTFTNGTDSVSETFGYDSLGNRVTETDALGNTVFRSCDPFGNVTAEWGSAYPVRRAHDMRNRLVLLATTRDGATWDETRWTYDPRSGVCLSKTYADGSTVAYTYTPDNLPLRTTCASGRWTENVYDSRRQVVGVEYSDGEIVSFAHDALLNEVAFSNDVASASFDRNAGGDCTNETVVVGNEGRTIGRRFDEFGRLSGIDGTFYDYADDDSIALISNALAVVRYDYTADRLDAGYSIALANGVTVAREVVRDPSRRELVADISTKVNGVAVESLSYAYDAVGRPVARDSDRFGYNPRGEVVSAWIAGSSALYGYDEIGNSTNWTANCLNQYAHCVYDADGNMTQCGDWAFTYDAASRLKAVSSNGVPLVTNFYDAKSRRVRKVTTEATTTFFYDGWNLVEERVSYTNGTFSTIRYYWGKDLSGTLQGAGGVGGLLFLTIDGAVYVPCYDNNGNVTRYLDSAGGTVAAYVYDAFGNIISQSGALADVFRHRFSTKYFDAETGLYYYGYRFYRPPLMRWPNRDPIEERGGLNLYAFCENGALVSFDSFGENRYITQFDILNIGGSGGTQMHVGVAVDDWKCSNGKWVKVGVVTFDFGPAPSLLNILKSVWKAKGVIDETYGLTLEAPITIKSTPQQDIKMLEMIRQEKKAPPFYNGAFHNCVFWSVGAINYGM